MSVSDLSKYYQFNCDKLIRLISEKGNKGNKIQYKDTNERTKNYKKKKKKDLTIDGAMKRRGNDFELKVKNELEKTKRVIDCRGNKENIKYLKTRK